MLHRALVCLLLCALAWGQTSSPKPATPQKPATPKAETTGPAAKASEAAQVPPDAPVITIKNVCDNATAEAAKSADCKTVVTRAEFERLLNAVAPQIPANARRQVATKYANLIVMAHEARKMGLDKGPHYEELMKIGRMQVLAQVLGQDLQEKAAQIPEREIQDYYKKNDAAYQEADLQRLFIPHSKQLEPPREKLSDEETKKHQDEADEAMKKEAEALHTRAASGEDFDKLQQEAFTTGGLKANPPSTKLGKVRRSSLPADQGAVFDLKSGEVSQLISGPNGYFVYKVGEKDTLPLEKVHKRFTMLCASRKCRIRCKQSSSYPTRCSRKNISARDLQGPSKRQPSPEQSSRRRRFLNLVRSKWAKRNQRFWSRESPGISAFDFCRNWPTSMLLESI